MTNQQLFDQLVALETNDCILWPKGRYAQGYGAVKYNGVMTATHRLAALQRLGPPPHPKMDAAHTPGIGCSRHCMNYRHLRWASRREIALDSLIDGTRPFGERHHSARLSDADVAAIRSSTDRNIDLARRYHVDPSHISKLRAKARR